MKLPWWLTCSIIRDKGYTFIRIGAFGIVWDEETGEVGFGRVSVVDDE